jgi:hypothetical protein
MARIGKKYFVQQYMQEEYWHGGAGFADAERIFLSRGFQPILFPYHHSLSLWAKLTRMIFLFKMFVTIKKNAVVFFLFPLYARMNVMLLTWLKRKNVRIVCYIADIDGIKDGNEKLLREEVVFFKRFRYFIVHNARMKEWLYKNVAVDCDAAMINFFDFLAEHFSGQRLLSCDVVFAGNLAKSSFLTKLHLVEKSGGDMHFHLYGPGQTNVILSQSNVTWHGVEEPHSLPAKLKGSFGLIWEGDGIEKPSGSLGHYIEYISHHKLSLYILAKLPVIVADPAASADLVREYKIGVTINSLYEIEEMIRNIPESEYMEMQSNMETLAKKISKGYFLNNAIDELMQLM